jgi:hypothetical protein
MTPVANHDLGSATDAGVANHINKPVTSVKQCRMSARARYCRSTRRSAPQAVKVNGPMHRHGGLVDLRGGGVASVLALTAS